MANLSQIKREKMLAFLETLKEQHSDDESLMAINQIERELTSKKYGLVWEEHEEEVDVKMQTHIPVFTEDKEREIVGNPDSGEFNFLLEGDNLHSLKLLEKTHKGKIDVIYIDPPYNTGVKDFVYDDTFIDVKDGYRHSKWLSFIAERLKLAQSLLSDSGCIFISIDANEFAQLKLLCDSIFGDTNFIGCLIWRKKTGGGQTDEFFVTEHEYIMGYRKTNAFKWVEYNEDANPNDYKYEDDLGKYKIVKLEKWGSAAHKEDRPTMYSSITDPDGEELFPIAPDGKPGRWRVGRDRLDNLINNNQIHWQKDKSGRWIPYEKVYFTDSKGKLLKSRSILYDIAETGTATKLLTNIFGKKDVFENPKPVELIKFILKHTECSLVLDFFAGSGSTAHAVMDYNIESSKNIKYILCTNNENNICEEVTYQRLKTVITGRRKDGTEYSDGIPTNLKYYKTDFISKDSRELYDDLLAHIVEMIQLEYGVKVDNQKYVMIMSDEEMDEFEKNIDKYPDLKAVFINQDVLLSTSQEQLFNNLDSYIIPDYYFDFELREAGEIW